MESKERLKVFGQGVMMGDGRSRGVRQSGRNLREKRQEMIWFRIQRRFWVES